MKKKAVAFTIADKENEPVAERMIKTLRHWHSEDELPVVRIYENEIAEYKDPHFFYRATPLVASKLIQEYDLVLKLDADQLILGSLDHLLKTKYDVGTVYNLNRIDPLQFPRYSVWDVPPEIYFNCGLVAMRSERFIRHWKNLCDSYHFNNYQMREQDLLNILCHYGDYKVVCLDDYDPLYDYRAWHGLKAKGEGVKMIVKDGEVILPKGEDNYPEADTKIKVFHIAGGKDTPKDNYRIWFNEEVQEFISKLLEEGETDNG